MSPVIVWHRFVGCRSSNVVGAV